MDKFKQVYQSFVKELCDNYPYVKKKFKKDKAYSLDNCLTYFLTSTFPFMNDISLRNEDAFLYKNADAEIVHGIKFTSIWDKSSVANKNVIWKYLHTLYLHMKGTPRTIVEAIDDEHKATRVLLLENESDILSNIISTPEQSLVVAVPEKKAKAKAEPNPFDPTALFEKTEIGKIAKEIVEEIGEDKLKNISDPSEIMKLLAGDSGDVMKNMFGKLDSKMKNKKLKPEDLLGEAQNMMSFLPSMFGDQPKVALAGQPPGTAPGTGAAVPDFAAMMKMMGGMFGPGPGPAP